VLTTSEFSFSSEIHEFRLDAQITYLWEGAAP
jgi:hypothetical protein